MGAYEHRQSAQWLVLIATIVAVASAMGAFMSGTYGLFGVSALFLLIGLNFSTLTTCVGQTGVSWAYTLGWPAAEIAFDDIEKIEITTTNFWLEGYGIHWTIWHGWLWNVSGYGAVMIHRRRGGRVTIGTDDPQGLYEAIARRLPNP